ncbi:MAG: alpha/beta fold hydrolase [Candidatus Binatia bacterium]
MGEGWRHDFVEANGVRLHYVTAGEGPLVVLLHGFPQFWYGWRHQIPALATKFRVVAPDMRGYNESDKPPRIVDYRIDTLAADVAALVRALGAEKAHVVGHDWGGGVAWATALAHPEAVDRLAVLNCPHPKIFGRAIRSSLRQLLRSWYMFFFQIPGLPEWLFLVNDSMIVDRSFRDWAIRKEAFTDEDLREFKRALRKPGALTAMINYYRAAFRNRGVMDALAERKIASPTLLVWAENDRALGKELTHGMEPLFTGGFRIHYVPNCSHWVNEEQPDLVNRLLVEHLS